MSAKLDWCVYVTYHRLYGFYYVGKSFTVRVTEGHYRGSGFTIQDELESERGSEYVTEVLETYATEQMAYDAERLVLGDRWKSDPLCLNRVPGGGRALSAEQKYKLAGRARNGEDAPLKRQAKRDRLAAYNAAFLASIK